VTPAFRSVLIAGTSVRGFAESAVRAGYAVTALDAFADLDLARMASELRRIHPYTARAVARAAREIPCDAVAYVSNFENHPSSLRQLVNGRTLLGNSPRVLASARDPAALVAALAAAGLPAARVRTRAPTEAVSDGRRRWLLKPRASGGGHGITVWRPGLPVRRASVLQERISGRPASVVFAADGQACVVFGVTQQLIGDRHFGARRFRYCGNLLAPPDDPSWGRLSSVATHGAVVASVLTRAWGLIGVNGVDFMAAGDGVVPIEVNPRYTAAMELIERRDGFSVFAAHVAGCTAQLAEVAAPVPKPTAIGKAILFARRQVVIPAVERWLADPDIRDVPRPGAVIPVRAPICTVFAAAPTMTECYDRLVERSAQLYAELETPRRATKVCNTR
jgi:uncharacterized protein